MIVDRARVNRGENRKGKASLPDGGEGGRIFFAFFSRVGLRVTAQQMAGEHQAQLVDLTQLDKDLAEV